MAVTKVPDFALLTTGTELETPTGIGRFRTYKAGNFRRQNVLVEFFLGKTIWFPEEVLKLVPAGERREPKRISAAKVPRQEELYFVL